MKLWWACVYRRFRSVTRAVPALFPAKIKTKSLLQCFDSNHFNSNHFIISICSHHCCSQCTQRCLIWRENVVCGRSTARAQEIDGLPQEQAAVAAPAEQGAGGGGGDGG
jgi:hypothetical protein